MTNILEGSVGGWLIGAASSVLLLYRNKVMGASGILSPLITSPSKLLDGCDDDQDHWKVSFVAAMMVTTKLMEVIFPDMFSLQPASYELNAVAGFLVAVGTAMSNGCTSGHGICGLGRMCPRSLIAVSIFCFFGIVTASVVNALYSTPIASSDNSEPTDASQVASEVMTFGLVGATVAMSAGRSYKKQPNYAPAIVSAVMFTAGLVVSGMINPHVVLGFLNFNVSEFSDWNATLCFVMGFGVLQSIAAYQYYKRTADPGCGPSGCIVSGVDFDLVFGSAMFGVGWGLAGVCPGPMIVNVAYGSPTTMFAFLPAFILGRVLYAYKTENRTQPSTSTSAGRVGDWDDSTLPLSDQIYTSGTDTSSVPKVKSWLALVPMEESETPPCVPGVDISNHSRILVSSDSVNTQETADELCKALDLLPRPTLVQCKSGARATAVARMYLAKKLRVHSSLVMKFAKDDGESWIHNSKLVQWVKKSCEGAEGPAKIIFRQFFEKESSTYTYLVGDEETREAVIIDPVDTTVDRDLSIAEELGLEIVYGVNTHAHADHVTGTSLLRDRIKAKKPESNFKSVISSASGAKADVTFDHGAKISFGKRFLEARLTPGHTAGCASLVLDDKSMVFTGDTLLVRGCGRTDFQEGSSETLYKSVHEQLYSLPDRCAVYPAHDYKGRTSSTILEEKRFNPRLGLSKKAEEFVGIMNNLNLSKPKLIDIAVPKNMNCGV